MNDSNVQPAESEADAPLKVGKFTAGAVLVYAMAVLLADTLAAQGSTTPFNWSVLHRDIEVEISEALLGVEPRRELSYFDAFKFCAWFAVPLLLSLRGFEIGYFSVLRWKRSDVVILGVMIVLGIGAVLLIPYLPEVKDYYRGMSEQPTEVKWSYARGNLLWTFSWLIGWEFMLRYFVLRNAVAGFGKHAWLIVPVLEFVYHFQKPFLEALLAGGGGVLLTYWALRRKNVLLPFLTHLSIELALLIFILVT